MLLGVALATLFVLLLEVGILFCRVWYHNFESLLPRRGNAVADVDAAASKLSKSSFELDGSSTEAEVLPSFACEPYSGV